MIKALLTIILVLAMAPMVFTGNRLGSPYVGEYAGPFTAKTSYFGAQTKQIGKITLSINADGDANGKVDNYTSGTKATLRGSIDDNGSLTLVCKYPGSTTTLKGTVNKVKEGRLIGELTQYQDDDTIIATVEIDLKTR